MHHVPLLLACIAGILLFSSCQESVSPEAKIESDPSVQLASEKVLILQTLNNETKSAFTRDYEGWKDNWIHEKYVAKSYMNFVDSTLSETLGWAEVDNFVRTYIENHPEPAPIPEPLADVDVRIYGNGAWVEYEQIDSNLGLKRESRLMEKSNGKWKIAGMQTVIYGFEEKN